MISYSIVLWFYLVFVSILISVHGSSDTETSWDELDAFAELRDRLNANVTNINGALQIHPMAILGEGGYGLVYSGIRLNDSRPVAIKFVDSSNEHAAQREYTIYSNLHAIDNATVERFGIPAVYYYGKWEEFIVMAITLCEGSLNDRENDFAFPLNALIVFQQFVRQSKYLHSHGVRHDDIKPGNIMLRTFQSFLIDFNLSSEMNDDTQLCTYRYKPRRSHYTTQIRKPIDDFESFFFGLCEICGVPLKWFAREEYSSLTEEELNREYGKAKRDVKDIINKIKDIESKPLRNTFMAFAKEIFSKDAKDFPNYDWLDEFITVQIKSVLTPNQPTIFFTWMDREDIKKALKHIRKNPIPNTHSDITDPRQFNFIYPDVDFDHFNGTTGPSSLVNITRTKYLAPC